MRLRDSVNSPSAWRRLPAGDGGIQIPRNPASAFRSGPRGLSTTNDVLAWPPPPGHCCRRKRGSAALCGLHNSLFAGRVPAARQPPAPSCTASWLTRLWQMHGPRVLCVPDSRSKLLLDFCFGSQVTGALCLQALRAVCRKNDSRTLLRKSGEQRERTIAGNAVEFTDWRTCRPPDRPTRAVW